MANRFKFASKDLKEETVNNYKMFYASKKEAIQIRSEKSKTEKAIAEIDLKIQEATDLECPDEEKIKELVKVKMPLADRVAKLSDMLKVENAKIKDVLDEVIPDDMYAAYVLGIKNADYTYTPKPKEIRSFCEHMGMICSSFGGHNITDVTKKRFANEVCTLVGAKTTSGKDFINGILAKAVSKRAFKSAVVQAILKLLIENYKVFVIKDGRLEIREIENKTEDNRPEEAKTEDNKTEEAKTTKRKVTKSGNSKSKTAASKSVA